MADRKYQLVESSYFTIGLATQWNLLSKVRPRFCYFRKLTPSFSLHLGMVFNSYSVLLPILATALLRLCCVDSLSSPLPRVAARAGYDPASIRINSAAFYQLDYQARESGPLFTGRPVQLLTDVAIHPINCQKGGLTGTPGWTRTNDHPIWPKK